MNALLRDDLEALQFLRERDGDCRQQQQQAERERASARNKSPPAAGAQARNKVQL
jgi:hypothetical protein